MKRPQPNPVQYHNNPNTSSSISINSSNLQRSSSSLPNHVRPNIDKQLQSLVVDDPAEKETEELLQQNFGHLDVDQQSYHSTPSSNHSIHHSIRDFSAFTFPFTERPTVISHHKKSGYHYYIATPTPIRNYLDYPDAQVLENLQLPYPFRVREPVSQRLERIDIHQDYIPYRTHTKRHSLALGEVAQLRKESGPMKNTASVTRTEQEIMSWMPDQRTIWQDWANNNEETSSHHNEELVFTDDQLHPLDNIKKTSLE
ncbi:uncharacterized protein BX663DRAFT_515675 [Cokeromyces recurvatus]|uniref:uncharacterized protein n=1 Tax=Cokeromyces recurvatus TaxID=90255 RepID=UPI00221F6630|nr:uncharacterized protein BX663DRAFT_515675 [Cokeromyces recurvatus]KAI7900905.1 hypothetical protein BX663DRAFT_515675 [Cokeromyces recurvatus]